MPKRKRLFTPLKNKMKTHSEIKTTKEIDKYKEQSDKDLSYMGEMKIARGRLQGALMEILEPTLAEDSEASSSDTSPSKNNSNAKSYFSDNEDDTVFSHRKQSYVLKLFDKSVDLSQFNEDSPLYAICRAWVVNKPRTNYREFAKRRERSESNDKIESLPEPEGPPISRIPQLLPEQLTANKDNINLNYSEGPKLSREQLLEGHMYRWVAVRRAWLDQGQRVEARYHSTQDYLNSSISSGMQ